MFSRNRLRRHHFMRRTQRLFFIMLIFVGFGMIVLEWNTLDTPSPSSQIANEISKLQRVHIQSVFDKVRIILSEEKYPGTETWPKEPDFGTAITSKVCEYASQVNKAQRVVINDIFHAKNSIKKEDVTIATQTSLSRLQRVKRMMNSWGGPISVALHIQPLEYSLLRDELLSLVDGFPKLEFLQLHIVLDLGSTDIYPVNFLRNVALNFTRTEKVFLLDIDFSCSPGLYETLKNYNLKDKDVVVVPSFEIVQENDIDIAIHDKNDILDAWDHGTVDIFRASLIRPAQAPTVYNKWRTATEEYKIQYELIYEPFALVKNTDNLPHYNEVFMNRHFDRSSFYFSLYFAEYNFSVLPKAFVLHYPHPSTQKKFAKYLKCAHTELNNFCNQAKHAYPELAKNLVIRADLKSYLLRVGMTFV